MDAGTKRRESAGLESHRRRCLPGVVCTWATMKRIQARRQPGSEQVRSGRGSPAQASACAGRVGDGRDVHKGETASGTPSVLNLVVWANSTFPWRMVSMSCGPARLR